MPFQLAQETRNDRSRSEATEGRFTVSASPGLSPNRGGKPAESPVDMLRSKATAVVRGVLDRAEPFGAAIASHLSALAASVGHVLAQIAAFPGLVYARTLIALHALVHLLRFVFVVVPTWLATELPRRVLATLRGIARGLKAFFFNEVVPTAEFFVEVPPALLGATVRDLFVRTPVWCVARGPGALADLAGAIFSQIVVLLVAMFDRARGLFYRLVEGVVFVWDTVQGGLRWILLLLFVQFAPWLLHFGFEAFDQMLLFAHSAVLLAIAIRIWMWQMMLSLPQRIIQLVQQTLSLIGQALTTLIQVLTSVLQTLPRVLEAIVRSLISGLIDALIGLVRAVPRIVEAVVRSLVELAHFLFIEVPLDLLRGLWDLTTRSVRALLIDLPRYLLNTLVDFVRTVREVVGELVRFVVQLPGQVWRLVVFLTTTLPRELARVVADIVRTLWEPTMVVLTWVLALVIAPFYFLARLLGLVGPGPLSRGGK